MPYSGPMGVFEGYDVYDNNPFNGVYLVKWIYFPENDPGKKWQAFFKLGNDRFAVMPTNDPEDLNLLKNGSITKIQLHVDNIGDRRRSGITEVHTRLTGTEMMPFNESFDRVQFFKEQHPKTGVEQWCATIFMGGNTTVKIVLDEKSKTLQPVADGLMYKWTPTAVLHRSDYGEFILIAAKLNTSKKERAQQVAELKAKQQKEAGERLRQQQAAERRHQAFMSQVHSRRRDPLIIDAQHHVGGGCRKI